MDDEKLLQDIEELKNIIKENKPKRTNMTFVSILLILILIGISYLCFSTYRNQNSNETFDSSHRVLLISIENDLGYSDISDKTQVKNALSNGGTIRVKGTSDGFKKCFGEEYGIYGAADEDGMYWTQGAVLNYIASRGWTFVQAPSSGFTDTYYFIK